MAEASGQVENPGDSPAGGIQDNAHVFETEGDAHIAYIRELALTIFDLTRPYHTLGHEARLWLEQAVSLNNEPYLVNDTDAPGTALKETPAPTGEQRPAAIENIISSILALRFGKVKKRAVAELDLNPQQKQAVLTLVAILRVANRLGESGSERIEIQSLLQAPGEIWLVISGPEAREAAEAAQEEAGIWQKAGYPRLKVLETGEAEEERRKFLPLPGPMGNTGIEPGDPMAEAGRKVWRFHFAEMLRHEKGTRLGEDIEALHDMRVATRRMRAAFDVFEQAFVTRALKPHLKGLRATGRALGAVRDLDVLKEKARQYLETLPAEQRHDLDPLLEAWEVKRAEARREMLAHLNSQDYQAFKWEFNKFANTPGSGARPVQQNGPIPYTVRDIAPSMIYSHLADVRAFDQILEEATIDQLHALRIEFKKLRYTVEFFKDVLGPEAKEVINDLKKMQDHLGDLNDAEVATSILQDFLDEWQPQQADLPIHERQSPEGIVTYLAARHAERHLLLVTFGGAWNDFNRAEFRRNLALAVSVL